jgi:hypothetical protein
VILLLLLLLLLLFLFLEHAVEYLVSTLCYKSEVSSPDEVVEFFNLPNSSSRTIALVFTQPVTDMRTIRSFWAQSAAGA